MDHSFWKIDWHNSPLIKLIGAILIGVMTIYSGNYFARRYADRQLENEMLKKKQEVVNIFARSITLTISYCDTINVSLWNRFNAMMKMDKISEKNKEYKKIKRQYEDANKLYEQYYEKYHSLDPPYTVSCEWVKLYFSDKVKHDIDIFQKALKEFAEVKEWHKINNLGEFIESPDYKIAKRNLENKYDTLLKNIATEIIENGK